MSIEEHDTIDFVAHDGAQDRVLLVMVAGGSWDDDGGRLPDLQSKLNAYLAYEERQLEIVPSGDSEDVGDTEGSEE